MWLPGKTGSVGFGRSAGGGAGSFAAIPFAPLGHKLRPLEQTLVGRDSVGRALAVADATLAAHLDFENAVAAAIVLSNGDIAMLKVFRLVRPQARVGKEKNVVVELLCRPTV